MSIEKKIANSKSDSRSMAFTEHGAYMRIFRICFLEFESTQLPLINFGSRLFTPTRRTDTIADIVQRLHDWIKHYTGIPYRSYIIPIRF